jgi:hypothetical protein
MSTAPLPPNDPRPRTARSQAVGFLADALRKGQARQAVRALREQTGLGLDQARDAIEGTGRHRDAARSDLSPGEVPRRTGWGRAVLFLLLLAALAWRWWGAAE